MKCLVIGSGTWGTALAQVLNDNGNDVTIFGMSKEQIDDINLNHKNTFYFGDKITLSDKIVATTNYDSIINDVELIVLSVPTGAMRSVLTALNEKLTRKVLLINTAKGFDPSTNKRMSELMRECIDPSKMDAPISLIGPSHAEEVIVRDLTCICAVSTNKEIASKVSKIFSNNYFRVYYHDDEIGSEIGVAMKNAIALASGMLSGVGYGDNARAALCTRGLAEIVRFGTRLGANPQTYLGLTGIGDLVVTCYSVHSRNYQAGYQIGKDNSAENFFKTNTKTVEGIRTVETIYKWANELQIDLPVIKALYDILFNNKMPSEVAGGLMNRPLKEEQ